MAEKTQERAFVEMARKLYPWFPPGELKDHEAPDFLLVDGPDRLGIEVTQLFQAPKHGARHPPQEVAKFHLRVMKIAEQLALSLPPLDVLVYFSYRHHMTDAEASAEALVEFVRTHSIGTYDMGEGIPNGFSVVRIAEPLANQVPRWYCLDSGDTLQITQDQLSAVIGAKNRRVPAYRGNVNRVWLLVASSFSDFASSFSMPRDIESWQFDFDFDFDKVLLVSLEGGAVSLQRREKAAQGV